MHRRGRARSHPGVVSPGWGLSTLRLLWNSSRGWTLDHSCIMSQCRRYLDILSRRVASGSPGCACAISGRGTSLTPGSDSMPSSGANHGCRLATGTGQIPQVRGRNGRVAGTAHTGWLSGVRQQRREEAPVSACRGRNAGRGWGRRQGIEMGRVRGRRDRACGKGEACD